MGFWRQLLILLGIRRRRRVELTSARAPRSEPPRRAQAQPTEPRKPRPTIERRSRLAPRAGAAVGLKALRRKLRRRDGLREAFVLKELLEGPLALRHRSGRTWR